MIKKLSLIVLTCLSFNVFAANPYTDCGIGAALFPNTSWAAVTSNVIWDAGITAVISATASEDTCSEGSVEAAQLIHDKYEALETDIILGQGSSLSALTSVLGCQDNSNLRSSIASDLRSILSEAGYAEASRVEKSSNLYEALKANLDVQSSCATFS